MNFQINPIPQFESDTLSVVINLGQPIVLQDGTTLPKFGSGLFKNIVITGEQLVVLPIGDNLEVSEAAAQICRSEWQQIHELFPYDEFKDADFYRSPKTKLGDLELNFWYCGENFSGKIHNRHRSYKLHTQILGQAEMQKFHANDENTLYYRELLQPGQTHTPFFDRNGQYPYHRYNTLTKSIWLEIQSPVLIP